MTQHANPEELRGLQVVLYDRDTTGHHAAEMRLEECGRWAIEQGCKVVGWFVDNLPYAAADGVSDLIEARPGLEWAIASVGRHPGSVLLVHTAARISYYDLPLHRVVCAAGGRVLLHGGQWLLPDPIYPPPSTSVPWPLEGRPVRDDITADG